jgi:hypothetical protein
MADQGGVVELLKRAKDKAMGFMGKLERYGQRLTPVFGPSHAESAVLRAKRLKQAGVNAITGKTPAGAPPPRPKSDISQMPWKPKRSMKHLTKGR